MENTARKPPPARSKDSKSTLIQGLILFLARPYKENGPSGPFLAKILELEEEEVVLDLNHPLAGKDLEHMNFEIEMVEIEGTTDFTTLKVAELKTLAKERGFKGYSTLKKTELVQLLNN